MFSTVVLDNLKELSIFPECRLARTALANFLESSGLLKIILTLLLVRVESECLWL